MRIVVLGAGAVGGYFGARLANIGERVTFLVRARRKAQIQTHGLAIHSPDTDIVLRNPTLALTPDEVEPPDIVIVGLKNYHLTQALPTLAALVSQGAIVLPLLNGIEHIETLRTNLGPENVLGGVCYIEATLDNNGHIIHSSPMQDIIFGAGSPRTSSTILENLQTAFIKSGVTARISPHIDRDMWQKYLFLTMFSGITAATRQPIGVALSDPTTRNFLQMFLEEVHTIAQSIQAPIAESVVDDIMNKLTSLPPSMTSSLHRDLEKGLPLEVDSLQGALLNIARTHGMSVPALQSIYSLLHPYVMGVPVIP